MSSHTFCRARRAWGEAVAVARRLQGLEFLVLLGQRHLITFLHFGVVGLSGVFVNMGILWLLTETGGVYYLISSPIAVEVSIVSNFLFNNAWTFREKSHGVVRLSTLVRYNLISAGGIASTTTILYLLTTFAGLHYMVANLVAIAVTTLWNFVANLTWTWRQGSGGKTSPH